MKNIIITGGAGFIGSNLAKKLIDKYFASIPSGDFWWHGFGPKEKRKKKKKNFKKEKKKKKLIN